MINYKANTGEVEAERTRDDSGHTHETSAERMYNGHKETEFDGFQLDEIDAGERAGVDVSLYAKPENGVAVMHEIRTALQKGLDVKPYLDRGFDSRQLSVITTAIDRGLTSEQIAQFADGRHNAAQMAEVAKGLRQGVDVSIYNKPGDMGSDVMRAMRHGLREGNDLSACWSPGVSGIALEQVLRCYKDGTDAKLVTYMIGQGMSDADLMGLADGLQKLKRDDVNCEQYVGTQVVELALGAHDGVDYERYLDPTIEPSEMRKMRNGLMHEGVCKDVKADFGVDLCDDFGVPRPAKGNAVSVKASDEGDRAIDDTDEYEYANEEIPY